MSTFNESQHPRHGDGTFASKPESSAGIGLNSVSRSRITPEAREVIDNADLFRSVADRAEALELTDWLADLESRGIVEASMSDANIDNSYTPIVTRATYANGTEVEDDVLEELNEDLYSRPIGKAARRVINNVDVRPEGSIEKEVESTAQLMEHVERIRQLADNLARFRR